VRQITFLDALSAASVNCLPQTGKERERGYLYLHMNLYLCAYLFERTCEGGPVNITSPHRRFICQSLAGSAPSDHLTLSRVT